MKSMVPRAGEHMTMKHSHAAGENIHWFKFPGKSLGNIDQKPNQGLSLSNASPGTIIQVFAIANNWKQPKCSIIGGTGPHQSSLWNGLTNGTF